MLEWRLISLPNNGVDGKDESDLTLTNVFFKIGDRIIGLLFFDATLGFLLLSRIDLCPVGED